MSSLRWEVRRSPHSKRLPPFRVNQGARNMERFLEGRTALVTETGRGLRQPGQNTGRSSHRNRTRLSSSIATPFRCKPLHMRAASRRAPQLARRARNRSALMRSRGFRALTSGKSGECKMNMGTHSSTRRHGTVSTGPMKRCWPALTTKRTITRSLSVGMTTCSRPARSHRSAGVSNLVFRALPRQVGPKRGPHAFHAHVSRSQGKVMA